MIDDALLYEGVALPSAQGFGELAGRYLAALLSVVVDEGADFLPEFGYFFFGCGPEVEFYFDNLVVHSFQYYCHSSVLVIQSEAKNLVYNHENAYRDPSSLWSSG